MENTNVILSEESRALISEIYVHNKKLVFLLCIQTYM